MIAKTTLSAAVRCSRSHVCASSSRSGSSAQVSEPGQASSSRNTTKPISITRTMPATCIGQPRQRAGAASAGAATLRLATAIARAAGGPGLLRNRLEDGLAVDDAHDAAILDGTHRPLAPGHDRDGVLDRRAHVELGTIGLLAGPRVAHHPAERQHVGARDVAHEVLDVLVGGGADQLLGRAELD